MELTNTSTEEFFTTDPGIPFHLLKRLKPRPPGHSASSEMFLKGLEEMCSKFNEKAAKDDLSSFLPHLPGYIDAPGTNDDSLQSLIDKPPVGGRELLPLTDSALQSFTLMPGSVPDQYKFMNKPPEKKKKKKHKHTSLAESLERKHKSKRKKEKKKKRKKDKKGELEAPT